MKKYYRIYFEDVYSLSLDACVFSAENKANALELFNDRFFGCSVVAIRTITSEVFNRFEFVDFSEVYSFYFTGEDEEGNYFESPCDDFVGTLDDAVKYAQEVANETGLTIYINSSNALEDVVYPDFEEPEPKVPVRFSCVSFSDDTHRQLFVLVLERMNLIDHIDVYREALAYLITLDVICREHIDNIYDFDTKCLTAPWQTSTSIKTILLSFNLFTGHSNWLPDSLSPVLLSRV